MLEFKSTTYYPVGHVFESSTGHHAICIRINNGGGNYTYKAAKVGGVK